jgi:aminoglycoside phosphotransferase
MEFFDVGAVVYFLRKVIWTVPGFTVDAYRERLRDLHDLMEAEGPFVAHSCRTLIEARKRVTARS